MISKSMKVDFISGREAMPVALLVQIASRFDSTILIQADNKEVNVKSIMGMMGLGIQQIENVTLVAEGSDEKEAIQTLEEYLTQ